MKTITINNKHYQECDVVMLPTYKLEINQLILGKQNTKYENKLAVCKQLEADEEPLWKSQHLFILSNDKINPSEWYINNNVLFKADGKFDEGNNPNVNQNNKKVIATTDNYLRIKDEACAHLDGNCIYCNSLLQIPQQFIEHFINEYNKGNMVSKILVEVEENVVR
jgi:hypothetical protein